MPAENCSDCGIGLVNQRAWCRMTRAERAESGLAERTSATRCRRCHLRERRAARATPKPTKLERLEWVAYEWEFLADPCRSQARNIEELAPRLGLTPDTLEKHLAFLRKQGRLSARETRRGLDGRFYSRPERAA